MIVAGGCTGIEPTPAPNDRLPEQIVRRPAPGAFGTAVRVVLYPTESGPVLTDALLIDETVTPSETGDLLVVDDEGAILARAEVPPPEVIAPPPLEGESTATAIIDWSAPLQVLLPWPERAAAIVLGENRIEYPPRLDMEIKSDEVVPEAVALDVRGSGESRWDIVFLPDGYTTSEMSAFEAQARRLVAEIETTSPFREYAEFFNFWMIPVASNTSGIHRTIAGDTRFACRIEDVSNLVRCDRRDDAAQIALASVASANISVIVANDRFGGRSSALSSSRLMIVSSASAQPVFVHELGHLFDLADEYVYTDGLVASGGINCSAQTPALWESVWTPLDPQVGSFLGCSRSTAYRPTDNSCVMRTLNHRTFCPICNEGLVRRIPNGFFSASPVARPEDGGSISIGNGPTQFRVEIAPIPTFRFRWALDGTPLPNTANVHALDGCAFGADTTTRHVLEVSLVNDSPALRPAYRSLHSGQQTWYLVGNAACGDPGAGNETEAPAAIESAHPYASNLSETFEVNAPEGTSRMRLQFSRIDLELNYDFLEVRDSSGAVVARYTGSQGETVTPEIIGNRATLHLTSDASVTRWGFALDRIIRVNETAPSISWMRMATSIESPTPYPSNHTQSWTISPQGATAVRIHFASFRTERNYDVVNVYDRTGARLASFSGDLGEFMTNIFANPPLRIDFRTDSSVTEQGFRIDWIEYR